MIIFAPEIFNAIQSDNQVCYLVKFSTTPSPIMVTDCAWDMTVNNDTYLGNGILLSVDRIKSTTEISVGEFKVAIAATTSILSILLNNSQINRDVEIYKVYLDEDGQMIDQPMPVWSGLINGYQHTSTNKEKVIAISVSSEWADYNKAIGRRTTLASQQALFPEDKGLEYAAESGKEHGWGRE